MSEEITTEVAQSEPTEAQKSNISAAEFVTRRLGQNTPPVEAKEEEVEETTDESPVVENTESEVAEQTEEPESKE